MSQANANPLVLTSSDPSVSFTHHARTIALHHGEKILAEIPHTLRRTAMLMLVLSISIPAFLAGLLLVLWHLG
jgi:hypothetical protein